MTNFWDNLFYDMDECGLTRELMIVKAGAQIREDLRDAEDLIRQLKPLEALEKLAEIKKYV